VPRPFARVVILRRPVTSAFADRIRAAREALRRTGERRSGADRRREQVPVEVERRVKERRRG